MNENLEEIVRLAAKEIVGRQECKSITLQIARRLIYAVQEKASEIGVRAVVAIANAAARPVAIECMDDSYIASFDIAVGKAYTCVALKMPTSELKMLSQPGGSLYGIQFTNQGQIVVFGGGDPLKYKDCIIGAIGVSGGTEQQDTMLSAYGAACLTDIIENQNRGDEQN